MMSVKNRIKRVLAAVITATVLISAVGCGADPGSQGTVQGSTLRPGINATPVMEYDEIIDITWLRVGREPLSDEVLEYLLLNFGINIDEIFFPSQNMHDDIMERYISGMVPDITTGISAYTAEEIAKQGFALNLMTEQEALANYFGLWEESSSAWAYTKNALGISDDEMYCMVPVNRRTTTGWIYNRDLFWDEGILFPETVEDLYKGLTTYREAHSASGVLWTNRFESRHLEAILSMYGLTDEVWQTDEDGNVIYLYAQKEWYLALEWLAKFIKLGVVPGEDGVVKSYTDEEYEAATKADTQIIEFTDTYYYMYIQETQNKGTWSHGDGLIAADGYTPVLKLDCPYVDEATCISSEADEKTRSVLLGLVNWLCSFDGNMWANFGEEGISYGYNDNNEVVFLRYYSKEVTPKLDPKDGSIQSNTLGRMFAPTPWTQITVEGYTDRYSGQEEYLDSCNARYVYETVFTSAQDVVEDMTDLWKYSNMRQELEELAKEFEESTIENGFSDYYWEKYYNSLVEAGLLEYTAHMQARKIR